MKKNEIQITTQTDSGHVILPYNEDQFKEFISSLLGSPQSFNRTFALTYELNFKDVSNLHGLVVQRVYQQNGGRLAKFIGKMSFSDFSSVELNSIEALLSYNETRAIIPRNLTLTWVFLVKFADKQVAEKQTIEITFAVPVYKFSFFSLFVENKDNSYIDDLVIWENAIQTRQSEIGKVSYRIEHTARTWSIDLDALLTDFVTRLRNDPPVYKRYIKKVRGLFSLFIVTISAVLFVRSYNLFAGYANYSRVKEVDTIFSVPTRTIQDLDPKLMYIGLNSFDYYATFLTFPAMLLCFLGGMYAVFLISSLVNYTEPSFLLFTDEAAKYKDKVLEKAKRKWFWFIVGLIINLSAGVISNFIFSYLYHPK